jgi:hypothetical protein
MKQVIVFFAAFFLLYLSGCNSALQTTIPLSTTIPFEDTYTIVWNGISEAYRFENGNWVRAANYDYQFDVIQKRYDKQWRSIKSLHRIHPDYDGKAGQRDQTMFFDLHFSKGERNDVKAEILSSLGNGSGITNKEFRAAELNINVEKAGMFMPYNKIRIAQRYDYEQGMLTETVELIKVKGGRETPFMKNEEKASFYIKGKLSQAPTVFQ